MSKKSKEELSKIAHKAVETRRIKLRSKDMLCAMLTLIKDGNLYHVTDLEISLSKIFSISDEELAQTLSSGQKRFLHRVGWAKWFLKKGELIDSLEQAKFKISPLGIKFLKENPNFTWEEFDKLPGWIAEVNRYKEKHKIKPDVEKHSSQIDVKSELLEKIKEGSPYFFEKLMADMLEKMGYGIGLATQKSHDGGIDGIVTADKLGLSEIYIQTKRYSGSVPISHIKEFIGTIQTTKTKTGVFITSGNLPETAHQFILQSGLNIQLIDGEKLADLMYDYDIGVKIKKVEPIKYIDEAFFVEEGLS